MSHKKNLNMGLVIPVYKNAGTIAELCKRLEKLELELRTFQVQLVTIFVIDGSPDNSQRELLARKKSLNKLNWKVLTLSRNFGQISAILAGLSHQEFDSYVCMSADLQDPIELVLEFAREFRNGAQIVIGTRSKERSDGIVAKVTSRIVYHILSKELPGIPKGGFDFFLLSKPARDQLLKFRGLRRFLQGDIIYLGFNPVIIEYERKKRAAGKSAYTFGRRLRLFFEFFLDVSFKPMYIIIGVGVLVSLMGFLFTLGAFLNFLRGQVAFNGFTPLFMSILIFGGLQLVSIGLLASYMLRIYEMLRNRPEFIVQEIYD